MMRSFSKLLWIGVLAALVAVEAPVLAQDVDGALDEMLTHANAIRQYGKAARRPLRSVRKKHDDISTVFRPLEREIRKMENEVEASNEVIEAVCEKFAAAAVKVLAAGIDGAPAIAKRRDATEGEEDKELLAKMHTAIFVSRAVVEIKKFTAQNIYFDGMYDALRSHRAEYLEAFTHVYIDDDQDEGVRQYAGEGMAQLAVEADRAETVKFMVELMADPSQPAALKNKTLLLMARLGERKPFDQRIENLQQYLRKAMEQEPPDGALVIRIYAEMANLYQGIHDYKTTALYYLQYLGNYLPNLDLAALSAADRRNIGTNFYNLACVAARSKNVELGLWAFETSLDFGYDGWDGALADGDLENLRADERFRPMLDAWRAGKKKPGDAAYEGETLTGFLKALAPKPAPDAEKKPAAEGAAATPVQN